MTYTPGKAGVEAGTRLEAWTLSQDQLRQDSLDFLGSEEYQRLVVDDQEVVRNPRGAMTPHVTRDGHIALLYYNNGQTARVGYTGRLLVWLTLGKVEEGEVRWSQPELVLWWDGVQLGDREDWNEDWAIVDGAGYHDIQELEDGSLAFVESNKLTVRYHEISAELVDGLRGQLAKSSASPGDKDLVVSREEGGPCRAPVLPDLRAGGGFTLVCWIDFGKLMSSTSARILVNGMSTASGALDEEAAEDITKGYQIVKDKDDIITLHLTDGFSNSFNFPLAGLKENYIAPSGLTMVAFIMDGGPKVASAVINHRLYNKAPCGWRFLPREFGEIGGSDVEVIDTKVVARFMVVERALTTSQAIQLFRSQSQ